MPRLDRSVRGFGTQACAWAACDTNHGQVLRVLLVTSKPDFCWRSLRLDPGSAQGVIDLHEEISSFRGLGRKSISSSQEAPALVCNGAIPVAHLCACRGEARCIGSDDGQPLVLERRRLDVQRDRGGAEAIQLHLARIARLDSREILDRSQNSRSDVELLNDHTRGAGRRRKPDRTVPGAFWLTCHWPAAARCDTPCRSKSHVRRP